MRTSAMQKPWIAALKAGIIGHSRGPKQDPDGRKTRLPVKMAPHAPVAQLDRGWSPKPKAWFDSRRARQILQRSSSSPRCSLNEPIGLGALFLSSFLAATLPPGGSELVFAGVLASGRATVWPARRWPHGQSLGGEFLPRWPADARAKDRRTNARLGAAPGCAGAVAVVVPGLAMRCAWRAAGCGSIRGGRRYSWPSANSALLRDRRAGYLMRHAVAGALR